MSSKMSSLNNNKKIEEKIEKNTTKNSLFLSKNIFTKNNNSTSHYIRNIIKNKNNEDNKRKFICTKIGKNFSNNENNFENDNVTTVNVSQTGESKRAYDIENKGKKKRKSSSYVPEYMKNYSLKITDTTEIDTIIHNKEKEGISYKYGLPEKNLNMNVTHIPINKELIETREKNMKDSETIMENIMEMFELNKNSSYETLIEKYNETFNNGK